MARSNLEPGKPGPGRPKGSPNKIARQAKDLIAAAAEGLGGLDRLIEWAKESPDNERAFWMTIYPKLVPLQVNGTHDVSVVDRTEQLQRAKEEVRAIFGERADGLGLCADGGGLPH